MNKMRPGERAEVEAVAAERGIKRRLLDIGLIPGREIECVGISPSGDPAAYLICGALIALRASDISNITVKLKCEDRCTALEAKKYGKI